MSVELLIPTHHNLVMNGAFIPMQQRGLVGAAVRDELDISELPHAMGGRDAKPSKGIRIVAPDGTQIVIMGLGVADAAEIQDIAYAALDKARTAAKANGGTVFNFRAQREMEGLPDIEDVPRLIAEGLERRIAQHKANPVSDPPRQMQYHSKEEMAAIQDEIQRLQEADPLWQE